MNLTPFYDQPSKTCLAKIITIITEAIKQLNLPEFHLQIKNQLVLGKSISKIVQQIQNELICQKIEWIYVLAYLDRLIAQNSPILQNTKFNQLLACLAYISNNYLESSNISQKYMMSSFDITETELIVIEANIVSELDEILEMNEKLFKEYAIHFQNSQ